MFSPLPPPPSKPACKSSSGYSSAGIRSRSSGSNGSSENSIGPSSSERGRISNDVDDHSVENLSSSFKESGFCFGSKADEPGRATGARSCSVSSASSMGSATGKFDTEVDGKSVTMATPIGRPPPPRAPLYSNGSTGSDSTRRHATAVHACHNSDRHSHSTFRSEPDMAQAGVFAEPDPMPPRCRPNAEKHSIDDVDGMGYSVYNSLVKDYPGNQTSASKTSQRDNIVPSVNPPDSATSSMYGGHSRTPMDDITPCGGPKMMVRPSKPDKPSRSKRTLHMETPSKGVECGRAMNKALSTDSNNQSSLFTPFQRIDHTPALPREDIHSETTRSPWTSKRVDELSSLVDTKARIQSPHVLLQDAAGNEGEAFCEGVDMQTTRATHDTTTTATIFGMSRISKRRSKKPPSVTWADKENSVNDSARSCLINGGGLRRRTLRIARGEGSASFNPADVEEEEERMHRQRRKRSRTTSDLAKSCSSLTSDSFTSSRSSSRSVTPTPDLQEEDYRRDRRRSSSISTLIHALGVEIGESDSPFSSSARSQSSSVGLRPKSYSQGTDFPGSGDLFDDDALGKMLCKKIVGRMKNHGIRLLALDWDLTVLDCHTRNDWYGPSSELARHIRPLFRHLMSQSLASGISVAIVTFSEQTRLVREALAHAIPSVDGNDGGTSIIVRGCDQSWDSSEIFDRYFDRELIGDDDPGENAYGKLPHLASAMREVERREGGSAIDGEEVLLVDDDSKNCMIAGAQKLKTIRFYSDDINRAFGEIGEMFSQCRGGADFDSPAAKKLSGIRISAGKWTPGSLSMNNGVEGNSNYKRK